MNITREVATHTPGPWHIKPDRKAFTIHIQSESEYVLTVLGMSETYKANARLIAAAPELLGALRLLLAIYGDDDTEAIDQAQAAIAKAEGRE